MIYLFRSLRSESYADTYVANPPKHPHRLPSVLSAHRTPHTPASAPLRLRRNLHGRLCGAPHIGHRSPVRSDGPLCLPSGPLVPALFHPLASLGPPLPADLVFGYRSAEHYDLLPGGLVLDNLLAAHDARALLCTPLYVGCWRHFFSHSPPHLVIWISGELPILVSL